MIYQYAKQLMRPLINLPVVPIVVYDEMIEQIFNLRVIHVRSFVFVYQKLRVTWIHYNVIEFFICLCNFQAAFANANFRTA